MSQDKNNEFMENFIKSLLPVIKSASSLEKSLNSPEINSLFLSIGESAVRLNSSMEPYIQTIALVQESVQDFANSINERYSDIKPSLYALSEKIGELRNNTIDNKDLDYLKEVIDNFSTQQLSYNKKEYLDTGSMDYEYDIEFEKYIDKNDQSHYYQRPISETQPIEKNDSPFYKDNEWYQQEVASFILNGIMTGIWMLAYNVISEIEFINFLNKLINFISSLKN